MHNLEQFRQRQLHSRWLLPLRHMQFHDYRRTDHDRYEPVLGLYRLARSPGLGADLQAFRPVVVLVEFGKVILERDVAPGALYNDAVTPYIMAENCTFNRLDPRSCKLLIPIESGMPSLYSIADTSCRCSRRKWSISTFFGAHPRPDTVTAMASDALCVRGPMQVLHAPRVHPEKRSWRPGPDAVRAERQPAGLSGCAAVI